MKILIACEFSGIVREAFKKRGHDVWSCDLLDTEIPGQHIKDDIFNVLKASEIIKNYIIKKPCAKQTTIAVIINKNKIWIDSNWCKNPQQKCPRGNMITGIGYELCKNICNQSNHAEINVCLKAGDEANGGTLYLAGHYYCCDSCKKVMDDYKIKKIVFLPINGWDMMISFYECIYLANSGVRWLYEKMGRWTKMKLATVYFNRLLNAPIPKIAMENPIQHKHARKYIRKYNQIIQPWQFGHGETKATCLWLKNLPLLQPTNIVNGREGRVWKESPSPDRWKNRSRTYQGIANAMADQWGKLN